LTADSENVITELDPTCVYIIGGIVDRNRYLNLTFNKAKKQGISHGKLPIGDHVKLLTSAVLAVNHVFEIVAE
jgi:tRNA (guanine9-N1)-methyltransferase